MRRRAFVLTATTALTAGCTADGDPEPTASPTPSVTDALANQFVGDPDPAAVRRRMDAVMNAYGYPPSAERYRALGDVLIDLRRETGAREMAVLTCMHEADLANVEGYEDSEPSELLSVAAVGCAEQLGDR